MFYSHPLCYLWQNVYLFWKKKQIHLAYINYTALAVGMETRVPMETRLCYGDPFACQTGIAMRHKFHLFLASVANTWRLLRPKPWTSESFQVGPFFIFLFNKTMVKDENKYNFDKDERVLCYHGPFIYEAKVERRDFYTCFVFVFLNLQFRFWKERKRKRNLRWWTNTLYTIKGGSKRKVEWSP